jgi:hypothetical protein
MLLLRLPQLLVSMQAAAAQQQQQLEPQVSQLRYRVQ